MVSSNGAMIKPQQQKQTQTQTAEPPTLLSVAVPLHRVSSVARKDTGQETVLLPHLNQILVPTPSHLYHHHPIHVISVEKSVTGQKIASRNNRSVLQIYLILFITMTEEISSVTQTLPMLLQKSATSSLSYTQTGHVLDSGSHP